ncbi:MAG: OmpA family protein [Flavobacteriaceae bacterium]|nr:OmpA family protein [Flavobacteriaceae bacterium]
MKKYNSIFIIILITGLFANAQSKATKKADKLFSKFEFVEAAKAYEDLIAKGNSDVYVYSQLAEAYYNVFNSVEAEKWYAKTLKTSEAPETIYKYAQMLKANGKYEDSNAQMAKFASMRPADHRAIAFVENPNYLPKILEKGKKFNVQDAGINSAYSDFGGTLQGGQLYIATARNEMGKSYGWNEEPFLDIYVAQKNDDGSFQAPSPVEALNTKYHEGVVSFSPDGNTMYFSRESYYDKIFERDSLSRNKFSVLNLYKSTKELEGWSEGEALSLNSENYSVKNPAVSPDGKTLFFASDMAGGMGQFDIYSAPINDNGSVGEATNLGQKLNTEGQEMFPFVSSDNTLYFSSDGHLGLGGMDVFFAKLVDGKVGPIRNVGIPVNGNADDFAFSINDESGEGFVSSNREGGAGSDDVYAVKVLQPICDVLVTVTVKDSETGNILVGATVNVLDSEGNSIGTKTTSDKGEVNYIVECASDLSLSASMENYESGTGFVAGTSEEESSTEILLDPIDEIILANKVVLDPIYFDFDKSNITAQAAFELDKLVQLMNKYQSIIISAESHTDTRGNATYNQKLSERRALTTAQYVISKGIAAERITGVGMGETAPVNDCGTGCSEDEHQMNRRSEFIILEGNPNNE